MASDKGTIVSDIKKYVDGWGGNYGEWYIGIASDPRTRLFNDHAVQEKGGAWIYRDCASSKIAREVEDHFIALGMKGGPGGGDATTKFVYAYKITPNTTE